MAKVLATELHEQQIDPATSREERKATGRMVALFVALLLILLVMYHAWIRKTPVLAGIMVPALIMLLYAAGVLFLAKRDKQRRLMAENNLRDLALSEINGLGVSATLVNSTSSSTKNLTSVKVEAPPPPTKSNLKSNTNRKHGTTTAEAVTAAAIVATAIPSAKHKQNVPKIDDAKLKKFEKTRSKYKVVNECAKPSSREQSVLARSLSAK